MMFLYLSTLNLASLVARATHEKQRNQKRYATLEDMI
jgi:hypothetical protein